MTCERCGAELSIGRYPFCKGRQEDHGQPLAGRGADVTWPGGKTFENLGHEPKTFYSTAELKKYLRQSNLEPFVRHQPVPGTDKSPHTISWAAVSRETLDGATAMLERIGTAGKAPEPQTHIQSMTVTITEAPGYVTTPIEGVHER